MGKNTSPIPPAVMARILQKAGAPRVSKPAAEELSDIIMDRAKEISEKAVKIAKHAKRRTVIDGDVRIAAGK